MSALSPAVSARLDRVCDPVPPLLEKARADAEDLFVDLTQLERRAAKGMVLGDQLEDEADDLAETACTLLETLEELAVRLRAGGDRR